MLVIEVSIIISLPRPSNQPSFVDTRLNSLSLSLSLRNSSQFNTYRDDLVCLFVCSVCLTGKSLVFVAFDGRKGDTIKPTGGRPLGVMFAVFFSLAASQQTHN